MQHESLSADRNQVHDSSISVRSPKSVPEYRSIRLLEVSSLRPYEPSSTMAIRSIQERMERRPFSSLIGHSSASKKIPRSPSMSGSMLVRVSRMSSSDVETSGEGFLPRMVSTMSGRSISSRQSVEHPSHSRSEMYLLRDQSSPDEYGTSISHLGILRL